MRGESIIALLRGMPDFAQVGGAAEFDAAMNSAPTPPAAFVMPLGESSSDKPPFRGSQKVSRMYGVVLATANVADAQGDSVVMDMAALRRQVMPRLLGFVPFVGAEPLMFSRGRLLAMRNGVLFWQDDFLTTFFTNQAEAWSN